MGIFKKALTVWLVAAFTLAAAAGISYSAAQQALRQSANWPQVQLAEDGARSIAAGKPAEAVAAGDKVDIAADLAPFVTVYDAQGNTLASSGLLVGQAPKVPAGVLATAKANGEDRVTWTPSRGVRIAAVVTRVDGGPGGYVLSGRSLQEAERTIDNIGALVLVLWAGSAAFLLVVCLLYGFVRGKSQPK